MRRTDHNLAAFSNLSSSTCHYAQVARKVYGQMVPAQPHAHVAGRLLGSFLLAAFVGAVVAAAPAQAARTTISLGAGAESLSAGGATAAVVSAPPYGAAAGTRLDRLPFLEPGTMAGGVRALTGTHSMPRTAIMTWVISCRPGRTGT